MTENEKVSDGPQPATFTTENRAELPNLVKGQVGFLPNPNSHPAGGTSPGETSEPDDGPATLLGDDETYPEGGLQAWLVVLGAWCALLAAPGLMNSIATFQTYIGTHQLSGYDEGTIGWIFSLYSAFTFFCGIYIGPLFDRYGPRWLILPGSICIVASMMLLSVCTGM